MSVRSKWELIGDYYYYKDVVAVGAETENLLDSVEMKTPTNPEYVLRVDIIAEGIQSNLSDSAQTAFAAAKN